MRTGKVSRLSLQIPTLRTKTSFSASSLCTAIRLCASRKSGICLQFTLLLQRMSSLVSVVQGSSLTLSLPTTQARNSSNSLTRTSTFLMKRLFSVLQLSLNARTRLPSTRRLSRNTPAHALSTTLQSFMQRAAKMLRLRLRLQNAMPTMLM